MNDFNLFEMYWPPLEKLKEKQYKQTSSVDQLAIHFALDVNMIHKESDEAQRQKAKLGVPEDSDIYCNGDHLTWVQAVQACWNAGGSFVPFNNMNGILTTRLELNDGVMVWTGDYAALKTVQVRDVYNFPSRYLCGYRNISSSGDAEDYFDYCNTKKSSLCCKRTDLHSCIKHTNATWKDARKACNQMYPKMWKGTFISDTVSADIYWIERVSVIKNISRKGGSLPSTNLTSCGTYDVFFGVKYVSCITKLQSFCKLSGNATDNFTKSCFKRQGTTTLSTTSTHGKTWTKPITTLMSTRQVGSHHSENTITVPYSHTTVRSTDNPLTSNIPSSSISFELDSKVSSTKRYVINESQENSQSGTSEGYGVKIGIPLSGVVLVSTIGVIVFFWRRRNMSSPKQQREDMTTYSETQLQTNNTGRGKPTSHCNLSYEMTAGNTDQNMSNTYSAVNKIKPERGVIHDQANTSTNIATVHEGFDESNGDYAEIYDNAALDRGVTENEYDTTKAVSRRIETENVYDKTFQAGDICNEYDSTDMVASKTVGYKIQGTENVYAKTFQANDSNNDYDSTVTKVNTDKFNNIYDKMKI